MENKKIFSLTSKGGRGEKCRTLPKKEKVGNRKK